MLEGALSNAVTDLTAVTVTPLALLGLGILGARLRQVWKARSDSSKSARRQRIRFGALLFSVAGIALVMAVQAARLPLWLGAVGIALVFASWAASLILSLVFGFREGVEEAIGERRNRDRRSSSVDP